MTISSQFSNDAVTQHPVHSLTSGYRLTWRQRKLLVKRPSQQHPVFFLPHHQPDRLTECLSRSPVSLLKLDLDLGENQICAWADASAYAHKPVYLRLRQCPNLPKQIHPNQWWIKRSLDWLMALLLLILLSPLMLSVAGLIKFYSPGPILFTQWRIGERGKLFRIIKFRTMIVGADRLHHRVMCNQPGLHKLPNDPRITRIGYLLRKYSLDELPQLINVLRGEMSLVGPRPWALYDAGRIKPELRHRLNALPGITGLWQVESRSQQRDLNLVNHQDLTYLHTWSLWNDLRILIVTIPKVFSGFGSY